MAGKKQVYDNSPFLMIAGNFSKYSDLTPEGKEIVGSIISKCAGRDGYPVSKVYYVLYNCTSIDRDAVMYWLQRYYAERKNESLPNDNTARKFLTITKQLSAAFVEAHSKGVQLFKKQKEGHTYMTPVQKYNVDKMYNSGASVQEIIQFLQEITNDDAK